MALKRTDTKEGQAASRLFSLLQAARVQGHIYHLQTHSFAMHIALDEFAMHIALDEFYKGITELVDEVSEIYQGLYDIIEGYKLGPMREDQQCITWLTEFKQQVMAMRYEAVPKEVTNFHNEVDNILSLADQTLYKLKNLK